MRTTITLVLLSGVLFVPSLLAQPKDDKPKDENKVASKSVAREIIEKAVKAHGGDIKVARSRLMNLKLRALVYIRNGEDSTTAPFFLEITQQLPDKYRSVMTVNVNGVNITRTIIINGDQGWITVNGEGKDLGARDLKEAREQMYAETVARLVTLRETGYELRALDEMKIENRVVQGVNVVSKGRRDVNLYFDKQTGLLVKMEHVVSDHQAKESSQEVLFAAHRDTNGPKYWGRAVVLNDHNRIFEAELAEVRFPDRLDESLFQKPREIKTEKDKSEKDKDKDKKPEKK